MKKLILFGTFFVLSATQLEAQSTEWDDYFMPGVGYKAYLPKNVDSLGTYHGVMTEFIVYARAKGKDRYPSGPARVKTYGNLSIMASDKSTAKDIFFANIGLNLSFEGNTERRYLLPYFGLELGGLFQRDFSTMHFSPVTGIQLISTKTIIWNIQGGYQYTTRRFDEYSGYTFSTTFNLLLWNRPDERPKRVPTTETETEPKTPNP
jgi:hypothetical protein